MQVSVLFPIMIIASHHLKAKGFTTKSPCKSNIRWGFVRFSPFFQIARAHWFLNVNWFLILKYSLGCRTDHKVPYEVFCKLEISSVLWKEVSTIYTRLGRKQHSSLKKPEGARKNKSWVVSMAACQSDSHWVSTLVHHWPICY